MKSDPNKRRQALMVLAAAAIVGSCATGVPMTVRPERTTAAEMQPLEVGWQWVYVTSANALCRRHVAAREAVGRFDCAVVVETIGDVQNRYWIRSERDGLKLYRFADRYARQDMDDPLVWFKYPARIGETWEYEARHGPVEILCQGRYEADDTITVPAGRFTCARVRTVGTCEQTTVFDKTEWYARGIGLVRQEITYYDGRHASMELKEIGR